MSAVLRADAVIVGGGIVGAAAAFFLRRRGRSVILLERGLIGQQASGVNFGNVRRQGRSLSQLPLANRARAVWGRMQELVGEDAEFLPLGHVRVCYTEAQAATFERYARDARALGLDLELLSAEGLRRRFGFFGPQVVAGSLSPLDGHANPRLAAPAFGRAAQREGATLLENAEVLHIAKDGEDFVVDSASGPRCRAPLALLCTGAWANRLASAFGEPVPIDARGPQMGVTDPLPYAIGPAVGVSSPLTEEGVYFRQITRGNIVFGGGLRGPADIDTVRARVEPQNTLRQLRELRRVAPALARAQLIRVWSGIEGYVADGLPVMGASARVAGLHYAFGFNGEGFAIGPGVGEVMAELMSTGASSTPIADFHIGRFAAQARAKPLCNWAASA